jgi:hypothetical protein
VTPRLTLGISAYLCLAVGQQLRDGFLIIVMNGNDVTQLAFPLGAFLGQYMTAMRLAMLELAGTVPGKSLGRTAVGFNLWHSLLQNLLSLLFQLQSCNINFCFL